MASLYRESQIEFSFRDPNQLEMFDDDLRNLRNAKTSELFIGDATSRSCKPREMLQPLEYGNCTRGVHEV